MFALPSGAPPLPMYKTLYDDIELRVPNSVKA